MTDINTNLTVIIPVHKWNDDIQVDLGNAINSIITNNNNVTNIDVKTIIVCPTLLEENIKEWVTHIGKQFNNYTVIGNPGKTDFCSQINYAVDFVDTKWFSILEFDDIYTPYWFKSFKEYLYSNEDVSLFLPINVQYEKNTPNIAQFCNEIVWANEFSQEMGYIDFECLDNFVGFNLTGGIFNTRDFTTVGRFKPSIEIAFNYEFLLRLTHMHLKVLVIPKEGYIHCLNRKDSLTEEYSKKWSDKEVKLWFELAKTEYPYAKDRQKMINTNVELLK